MQQQIQEKVESEYRALPKTIKNKAIDEIYKLTELMPYGLSPNDEANYRLQIPTLLTKLAIESKY
jgi:hypothetical protein